MQITLHCHGAFVGYMRDIDWSRLSKQTAHPCQRNVFRYRITVDGFHTLGHGILDIGDSMAPNILSLLGWEISAPSFKRGRGHMRGRQTYFYEPAVCNPTTAFGTDQFANLGFRFQATVLLPSNRTLPLFPQCIDVFTLCSFPTPSKKSRSFEIRPDSCLQILSSLQTRDEGIAASRC